MSAALPIRARRVELGMPRLADLAAAAQLSISTVSAIERGLVHRGMDESVRRLARALQWSVTETRRAIPAWPVHPRGGRPYKVGGTKSRETTRVRVSTELLRRAITTARDLDVSIDQLAESAIREMLNRLDGAAS